MNFKKHKLPNKLTKDNADKDAKMLRAGKNFGRTDSPDDDNLLKNVDLSPKKRVRPIITVRQSFGGAQEETKQTR